ncbi:DMT family transporter [Salibacterium lacus]|uniref:DMT family transporter n=1 Tax=Salibacterium lacus TaxID=1898109 RepID=A0ABW5T1V8_9BACI
MRSVAAYGITMLGASFWGLTGLFVQRLYMFGFSPIHVVTIRMVLSMVILFSIVGIIRPYLLKIHLRDLPYFIGLGVVSIALFNWFYFTVMEQASLSVAVVLLYTSPVFVALMSRFVFQEAFTVNKIGAVVLTTAGCSLVAGFFPFGSMNLTVSVVFFGLASGFFCGLYSIIGKSVSRKYHSVTITAYSMMCGGAFLLPVSGIEKNLMPFLEPIVWIYALGSVLVSTILAYVLYTAGLKYIESSHAAVLATIEPIVGIIVGVLVFGDELTGWQSAGIVLVFSSIILSVFSNGNKFTSKRQRRYFSDNGNAM